MRAIGVHVCEGCGQVYDTIGPYLRCLESHVTIERGWPFTENQAGAPIVTEVHPTHEEQL
jgi:hypothetical protein